MLRPLAPHSLRSGLTLAFVLSLSGIAGAQSGAAADVPINECEVDADCGHGFACETTLSGSGGTLAMGGAGGVSGAPSNGGTAGTASGGAPSGAASDPVPPMSTGGTGTGALPAYICGDSICQQPYETQASCPIDCGAPMVWKYCAPAQCNEPADCAEGYRCDAAPVAGTGGASSVPSFCGDGVCFQPENSMTCPEDCTSLGYCEPEMTQCASSAQCPAGFYCSYDFGTGGASSGTGGVAGAAGAGTDTGTAGTGTAGTVSGFAPPEGVGGTSGKAAPLPPQGGTSGTAGSSGSTGVGGSMVAGTGGVSDIGVGYCLPGGTGGGAGGTAGTGQSTGGTGNVAGTLSMGGSSGSGEPCPGGGCGAAGSGGSDNGAGGSGGPTSGGTGTMNAGGSNPGSSGSDGSAGRTKDIVTHAGCSVSGTRATSPFGVFALLGAALALTRRRAPRAARR